MEDTSKKIQNSKPKSNPRFSYRKQGNIRVLHKTQQPNINKTTNILPVKQSSFSSDKAQSLNKKNSRGSYQYSNIKRGNSRTRKEMQEIENKITIQRNKSNPIPPPEKGIIRIIPLGGVEEIGKNMTAIEIGDDIVVIDAGMQFKTEDTPGIDYIIPNTTYLEERKDKIRAMLVTHGHLDHIGGIPLVMSRIGNPPLYSRNLSILVMRKRQEEFPHLPPLNVNIVEKNSVIQAGNLRIRFFGVTHTMPDSMGIVIETPYGSIVTPGDYKLDQIDGKVSEEEEKEYAFFDKEKVLLLMTVTMNSGSGIYYAWVHCDTVGKLVVILLFLGSIITWTIMIEKGISLYRAKKASMLFIYLFREKQYPLALMKKSEQIKSPVSKVYQNGAHDLLTFYELPPEFAELYGTEKHPPQKLTTAQIETIRSSLERGVTDQVLLLEDKLGILATAVSASPFFGLFGTVWGITMAFAALAVQGRADMSALAPGVSGALITTIVGLLVAIPSLIGYNLITVTIRKITVSMDNFVEEFMAKVKHDLYEK